MCSNWNYFGKATHTNCFINHSFACSLTQSFIFAVLYMQARFRLQFSIFIYLWLLPNATHKFQFRFRAWINFNKHTNQIWCVIRIQTIPNRMCINWSLEIIYWWDLNDNSCAPLTNHELWTEKLLFVTALLSPHTHTYAHSHITSASLEWVQKF